VIAPVSICLIVRDEIAQLERCLSSVRPHVAEICVVDTGSKDASQEVARRFADKFEVYTGCNHPNGLMRSFADARQRSFNLATQPWVMWIDGDDEVVGAENLAALVKEYDRVRDGKPSMVMMPYEYAHDEHGNVTLLHDRERLVAPRDAFKWMGRVHEVLVPINGDIRQRTELVKIVHRRDTSRKIIEPGRNLRILKEQYEDEGDGDARHLYYLGLEYGNNNDIDNAIKILAKYVDRSGWDDEKYLACLRIADHHISRAEYDDAVRWCQRAIIIRENWGEAYFQMAKCFYFLAQRGIEQRRNWEKCVHFARVGLNFPPTQTPLFINPLDRTFEIHRYLNVALNAIGLVQDAKESTEKALSVKYDDNLKGNLNLYGSWLARQKIDGVLNELSDYGSLSSSAKEAVKRIVDGHPTETSIIVQSGGVLPERAPISEKPDQFSQGVLLAMFEGVWKTLILHDELLAARTLMQAVPWQIRDTIEVDEMRRKIDDIMSHHDDPEVFAAHYAHTGDAKPNEVIPMPQVVPSYHSHRPRWDWLLEVLSEKETALGRKLDVLDIGSMDGWVTNRVGSMGHRAFGIDTSALMVDLANSKASEFSTGAIHEQHDFMGNNAPIPDDFPKAFDVVVLYEVYEHLHESISALTRARSILKNDGVLVVSTPRGSWGQGQDRPGHHAWNADSFREHIRAPIAYDLEKDFAAAGFHNFDSKIVDHPFVYIPGQASLLVRGSSTRIEHIRSSIDIALYVGWNTEPWNPETAAKTGIGGSETAAMEMARLLTARGNRVRLYGECSGLEGTFSGVEYLHHSKFSNISCDALVVSRRPQAIDAPGLSRKATLCWVHDVHCGSELTHERALKIDKFLTLSQWHKGFFLSQYDFLHPSQVDVTRNGIGLTRFNSAVYRNPHRAVYSSSPDRGMEVAVRSWHLVRKQIPDAELHIYYGFDTWEACVQNDQNQKDHIQRLKKLLADNAENGVFYHGRVDQKTLAREYLSSGVWAYSTWFNETSCISAMEAHAAGLRMVTSPIAALNETVGRRGTMVPGDCFSSDYQARFVNEVVSAMGKPDDGDRNALQAYARDNFSWDDVAKEWDSMLRKTIDEAQDSLVVQYRPSL